MGQLRRFAVQGEFGGVTQFLEGAGNLRPRQVAREKHLAARDREVPRLKVHKGTPELLRTYIVKVLLMEGGTLYLASAFHSPRGHSRFSISVRVTPKMK